jgi:hypothetical protein
MGAIGVDTCGDGTPGYRHVHFVLLYNGAEVAINGLSIGGYTIHEAPGAYCGTWTRNSDGSTVASSLTLDPPSTTWPQGRCPRMAPGLTNAGTAPPSTVLSPTPTPSISGTARVGQTLTAAPGTWGPAPVTLRYQWYRGATAISGATATTYKVQSADVGSTLKVAVTGSKTGYASVTKTSATTATVVAATSSANATPFGNYERARAVTGGVEVKGWAIDPDTTASIYVWVTVDGAGRHLYANVNRPDVGAVYPASGPRHGFLGVVPAAPGTRRVCVTASNVGPGSHKSLGCRTVTVPAK